MNTTSKPEFARNYGFWNEAEQEALANTRVAIAGVGGDGFQLGLKLAMMGVRTFDVADPEVFEKENSNRVLGATEEAIGRKKADVFLERVTELAPDADVRIFDQGINEDNIDDFTSRATLTFDETELTKLELGTMLARSARERAIPNVLVMNIGFAALVTSFHPNHGKSFEQIMGIPGGAPLEEVKDMKVQFDRCLPYVPTYGDLDTLLSVQDGAPLPSIAQGVDIASALGTTEAFFHATARVSNRRPGPTWAPKFKYMDAYTGTGGTTRFPRLSHQRHVLPMALRSKLGLNPKAAYTSQEIRARQASV